MALTAKSMPYKHGSARSPRDSVRRCHIRSATRYGKELATDGADGRHAGDVTSSTKQVGRRQPCPR